MAYRRRRRGYRTRNYRRVGRRRGRRRRFTSRYRRRAGRRM